jgi:malate dehydrogenase (oxaloacetate-decarboxylating)(NADP+)
VPGQGNNAYIFPGVGLGVMACGATRVSDEMFYAASWTLAAQVSEEALEQGLIYPPLRGIRHVSAKIAAAVAATAYDQGLASKPRPPDMEVQVRSLMYEPMYVSYV